MAYRFSGVLYGFDGPKTADHDAIRLKNHLEAFTADSIWLFANFVPGNGRPLPPLDDSRIGYVDPGDIDPPLQDCVVTFLSGQGACGALAIYDVGYERFHGRKAGFRLTYHGTFWDARLQKKRSNWHVDAVRWDGVILDPRRRTGKGGTWRALSV